MSLFILQIVQKFDEFARDTLIDGRKQTQKANVVGSPFGSVWFVFSNNNFQFLNNITHISTHFFTHTYLYTYFQIKVFSF